MTDMQRRLALSRNLLGLGAGAYAERVLGMEPANLIGYWPLWEASGTKAEDISGRGHHGVHTGVTLGQPGIGDGRTCPLFDGTNDFNNVYSAALAADFNGAEGTLLIWAKVANAGVWTDGVARVMAGIGVDGTDNFLRTSKDAANNSLSVYYEAGGTIDTVFKTGASAVGYMCLAMTWSKSGELLMSYYNGAAVDAGSATLGTWAGALASTRCVIGAATTTPALPWSGNLAHCALWSKALTAAQIAYLSKV
jgi:hypothetical protein